MEINERGYLNMDEEEQKAEEEKPETPAEDKDEGVQSATDEKVKLLNAETERIKLATAEYENAKARQKIGGGSEAGQEPKKEDPAVKLASEMVEAFK